MRLFESPSAAFVLCIASACGPSEPAEAPTVPPTVKEPGHTESAPEPPASETTAEAPESEPAASETSAEAPESEPAPAPVAQEPTLRELCDRVCVKLETRCSKAVAQNCRVTCERYDSTPGPCHEVGRDALVCWEGAPNLLCANVVPDTCAKPFRRLATCQNAPESFVYTSETSAGRETGLERFEPAGEAFVAMMPRGVEKTREGAEVRWSAEADGVRYIIRKLPPAAERFTAKSQVRLAMQWLAPCTHRLKLHGQVDTDDGVSVHYDGVCEEGAERHGIIYITPSAVFIVGTEGPSGQRGHFDAFVYGFKPAGRP